MCQEIFVADDNLFIFYFFQENKSWHFIWIVCLADNSYEMSGLISFEKLKKMKMSSAAVVIGTLTVNP